MYVLIPISLVVAIAIILMFRILISEKERIFEEKRNERQEKRNERQEKRNERRDYYRNVYLKSEAWKRKRYVVFKRDNWRCVYCGNPATQVHHKRYARKNIGKEPIEWLVSVCKPCHDSLHQKNS